jgi:hypothetical protein
MDILPIRESRESHEIETESTSCSSETETERWTYFQPPDGTIAKLHSGIPPDDENVYQHRASRKHLLISDLDQQSETVEECSVSHPRDDANSKMNVNSPCDDESVFRRDGSCKSTTSKFSTYSSVSAKFCTKPEMPDTVDQDLCAWGQFAENGGRLTIKGTGVSLYIPSMALPNKTSQVIYIGLMNSKGKRPQLRNVEALLSPVVVCGPDGLQFEKPVYLTVPHNAVLDENNSWTPQGKTNKKHT